MSSDNTDDFNTNLTTTTSDDDHGKEDHCENPTDDCVPSDCQAACTVDDTVDTSEEPHETISLNSLVEQLELLFNEDEVDVDHLSKLMESCSIDRSEWDKYAYFLPEKYTRNLVSAGNEKYNLLLLCWDQGQSTFIHDHSGAHCLVKVMMGTVRESLYEWPSEQPTSEADQQIVDEEQPSKPEMKLMSVNCLEAGGVTYIHDKIGLHKMENASLDEQAVTLHLYSPPYDISTSFEEKTCKPIKFPVKFYSRFGEKV